MFSLGCVKGSGVGDMTDNAGNITPGIWFGLSNPNLDDKSGVGLWLGTRLSTGNINCCFGRGLKLPTGIRIIGFGSGPKLPTGIRIIGDGSKPILLTDIGFGVGSKSILSSGILNLGVGWALFGVEITGNVIWNDGGAVFSVVGSGPKLSSGILIRCGVGSGPMLSIGILNLGVDGGGPLLWFGVGKTGNVMWKVGGNVGGEDVGLLIISIVGSNVLCTPGVGRSIFLVGDSVLWCSGLGGKK
jgi:hypothetical protein